MPKVVYSQQLRRQALVQVREQLDQGADLAHAIADTADSLNMKFHTLESYWHINKRHEQRLTEPRIGVYVELTAQQRQACVHAARGSRLRLSDWIRQAVLLNLEPWHEYRYEEKDDPNQ